MRIKSGIEGFDVLVEGGFLQGRQYLVSGSPGSGKNTLSENIGAIIDDMSRYNLQIDDLIKKKKLFFIDLGSLINYGEHDEMSNLINTDYEQGDNPANQAPTPFSLF